MKRRKEDEPDEKSGERRSPRSKGSGSRKGGQSATDKDVVKPSDFDVHELVVVYDEAMPGGGVWFPATVLAQKLDPLWRAAHQVFVGVFYGESKYFGYLCRVSDFVGVCFNLSNKLGLKIM